MYNGIPFGYKNGEVLSFVAALIDMEDIIRNEPDSERHYDVGSERADLVEVDSRTMVVTQSSIPSSVFLQSSSLPPTAMPWPV